MLAQLRAATTVAVLLAAVGPAAAQTFQRHGTCPTLGCVIPPDQSEFLPGQYFDIRVEVHAPVNGSEAFNKGVPDESFTVSITKEGGAAAKSVTAFFGLQEPKLEKWTFGWYEDLFAEDAKNRTLVNVASKAYRRIALYEPGKYTVTLSYFSGKTTTARWTVRPLAKVKKAKNIIIFIGESSPCQLTLGDKANGVDR
jgi:hypothetical protein